MENSIFCAVCKNNFSKAYSNNWSKEIFVIDSVFKTNPWAYKIKELNRERIVRSFYEKESWLSKF